jgi:hypothetical protein
LGQTAYIPISPGKIANNVGAMGNAGNKKTENHTLSRARQWTAPRESVRKLVRDKAKAYSLTATLQLRPLQGAFTIFTGEKCANSAASDSDAVLDGFAHFLID